eukprot:2942583-Rhodomonas_salina.1
MVTILTSIAAIQTYKAQMLPGPCSRLWLHLDQCVESAALFGDVCSDHGENAAIYGGDQAWRRSRPSSGASTSGASAMRLRVSAMSI